ncbi:unnamed protein product [Arctia plantaginis]|uniref:Farnesyl pyrophosphate synthase n=1 Tax=Arctia plantaginis TaxID=874455 RepID=A0A8S1BBA4_ARCPL|nr:unnamed protein product [Arctia plantaginis]
MNICRKSVFNVLVIGKNTTPTLATDFTVRFGRRFWSTTMSTRSFDIGKEKKDFFNALPNIIDNLAEHPKFQELPIAKEWMKKVINGTVPGGKASRGLTTVMSFKMVEQPEYITKETIRLAHALGWCTEFLQAYCVVLDDIVDGSLTRRGQPCWYRREDVGMAHAVNDATLIYYSIHRILKNYFEKSPIYVKLYQAFNETLFNTSFGQFLDIRGSEHKKRYESFTRENYEEIIKYKTAYYTYKLPISIGLMLANKYSEETKSNCEDISFQLGKLFQIQDDYIDCFGDESLTGKKGTDIQEGKCTWLAVNALERCNKNNRAVFAACYGSKEPAHVERIKQLYTQLKLPQFYKEEERQMYNNVVHKIKIISSQAERELFNRLLDMTYDRKK